MRASSIAANGMLAFRPGAAGDTTLRRLVWVDRQGRETPIGAQARAYVYPRLSPDGTRIAVSARDEEHDIWVFDISKETLTRVTFGPEAENFPVWSFDGRHLFFGSVESSLAAAPRDLFRKAADGTGTSEALTATLGGGAPQSVSADGKWLVFHKGDFADGDLFLLPLVPAGEPRPLLTNPRYQLLFEMTPYMDLFASLTGSMGRGPVGRLFDIAPDGQRFLMTRSVAAEWSTRPSIIIVSNWFEELKARVPPE